MKYLLALLIVIAGNSYPNDQVKSFIDNLRSQGIDTIGVLNGCKKNILPQRAPRNYTKTTKKIIQSAIREIPCLPVLVLLEAGGVLIREILIDVNCLIVNPFTP